jgi:hypothetical protein
MHDIDHSKIHDENGYESWESGPFEFESFEGESPCASGPGNPECEMLEMELATEFLEIGNEDELDEFAGNAVDRLAGCLPEGAGRFLVHAVKESSKKILPSVGGYGDFHGAVFRAGAKPADAGRLLGLELEGLSGEDQEFEVARQFIRFVRDMIRHFSVAGKSGNHRADVRNSVQNSARINAPGLLRHVHEQVPLQRDPSSFPGRSGRWFRRGRKIIIYGV